MGSTPQDVDIWPFQVNTKHLCTFARLFGGRNSRAQLLYRQRAWCADNACEKRCHACARHPTRISSDLVCVDSMKLKATTTVCVNIDKTRHNDSLTGIQNFARSFVALPDLIDMPTLNRNVTFHQIHCGIDQ